MRKKFFSHFALQSNAIAEKQKFFCDSASICGIMIKEKNLEGPALKLPQGEAFPLTLDCSRISCGWGGENKGNRNCFGKKIATVNHDINPGKRSFPEIKFFAQLSRKKAGGVWGRAPKRKEKREREHRMDLAFYAAAAGAAAQKKRLSIVSNNLANISTTGFKSEDAIFTDLIYNELDPPAREGTQLTASSGAWVDKTNTNFDPGIFVTSESPYDYAIMGDGFFGLRNPATEEITYTRDGSFRLSLQSDGRFFLTSQDGKAVMSTDNEPIVVTEENKDGILPIAVFCFRNQNGMLHAGGNEYRPVGKNNEAVLMEGSDGMLRQYCKENSNVDIADEFIKMIESQRAYQYALKMVQTTDEIESTINGLRQ